MVVVVVVGVHEKVHGVAAASGGAGGVGAGAGAGVVVTAGAGGLVAGGAALLVAAGGSLAAEAVLGAGVLAPVEELPDTAWLEDESGVAFPD